MTNGNGRGSDVVAILTAFFALLGTSFTAFLGYKMAELSQRTAIVAEQNVDTAQKLTGVVEDTAIVKKTTLQSKDYVNHLMEVQLELNAKVSKRLADTTHDAVDISIAEKAEKDFQDHVAEKKKVEEKERLKEQNYER